MLISIDIPTGKANRLKAAFGKMFQLFSEVTGEVRPATDAEIEAYVVQELKRIVVIQERADAVAALPQVTF